MSHQKIAGRPSLTDSIANLNFQMPSTIILYILNGMKLAPGHFTLKYFLSTTTDIIVSLN